MTAALLVAAAALVVFAIAAVAVGQVVATESSRPRQAVYDLHEATDWVAERLPFEVQARISHDDVHTVLSWYLDELEVKGVAYRARRATSRNRRTRTAGGRRGLGGRKGHRPCRGHR